MTVITVGAFCGKVLYATEHKQFILLALWLCDHAVCVQKIFALHLRVGAHFYILEPLRCETLAAKEGRSVHRRKYSHLGTKGKGKLAVYVCIHKSLCALLYV